MLQLARAQDQTNRHLQQHLQQGQINMQAHTGALQQLAPLHTNAILIIFLLVYQSMMEVAEKVSFHGWNDWKLHASIVEEISKQKLWVDQLDLCRM